MEQVNSEARALFPYEPVRSFLERIEKRTICVGGYKSDALLEYLANPKYKALGHWTEVDILLQVFDGRISDKGRTRMRQRLARAFHQFRIRGYLLLFDRQGWSTRRVKLMNPESEQDRILAIEQILGMQELCEERDKRLDHAATLAGITLNWDSEDEGAETCGPAPV